MGAYHYNFAEICRRFEEQNCLLKVSDTNDLAKQVTKLFTDDSLYQGISEGVQRVLESNRGARARIGAVIEQWLFNVENKSNYQK